MVTSAFDGKGAAAFSDAGREVASPIEDMEGGRVPSGVAYDVFGVACQLMHSNTAGAVVPATQFAFAADTPAEINDIQNVLNNVVLSWD